jgi:hypothetical protein
VATLGTDAIAREHRGQQKAVATKRMAPTIYMAHSQVVEIPLWEYDIEAAWNEVKSEGCDDNLWFQLTERREENHPEDAIAVYVDQLKPALLYAEKRAYEEVVQLLHRIHKLLARMGKSATSYSLSCLSVTNTNPPQFHQLLDAEGW